MCSVCSLQNWIEEPEKKPTFDRPLEMAEKSAAKHWSITLYEVISNELRMGNCFHFSGMVCRDLWLM